MAKKNKGSLFWKLLGFAFAIPAGIAVRKVLDRAWTSARGDEPPKNPAAPGTNWMEALAWAAASGIAIAFGRLVAARGAAATYKKLTGKLPPGLESEGP
ncbi:MAG: DUF4235 domain-containing protein [Geodermatophilaceae bacterium]|nr:DUF4235 domain-containing protein [Geodermatophilaceae bacterium]